MTTRRGFLHGIGVVVAGLILPPTLAENAEAARRFWALDQTMVSGHVPGIIQGELTFGSLPCFLAGLFGKPVVTELDGPSFAYEWTWDARILCGNRNDDD